MQVPMLAGGAAGAEPVRELDLLPDNRIGEAPALDEAQQAARRRIRRPDPPAAYVPSA